MKILVVDNNPVMLKLMTNFLSEKLGHHVVAAVDGLSALEALEQFRPEVMFIDLVMPKITGDKLCRIIRDTPEFTDISLVILSAYAAEEDINYWEFGADACIAKGPFRSTARHIETVLDRVMAGTLAELPREVLGQVDLHRRAVTSELISSKRHFENILDSMRDGVLEVTLGGKIIYANTSSLAILGLPEEKLLSMEFTDLLGDDQRQPVRQGIEMAKSQQGVTGMGTPIRINGRQQLAYFIPVTHENTPLIVVVLHDITEQLLAEKKIRESEANYRSFAKVGLALSMEKNINILLEMIVQEARNLTRADGGTLYLLDKEQECLVFEILQSDSLLPGLGERGTVEASFPNVPLFKKGAPNYSNVASYAAQHGEIVNIEDVYETGEFDFEGPKLYDRATGYHSKSMLVIPLKDHQDEVIGIIQLLNAKDPDEGEIVSFSRDSVELVSALASQAAVALSNVNLVNDLQRLFYSFIRSIATAIDEKSPYTGGHIRRVYDLTMMIAKCINETVEPPFHQAGFDATAMEELRLAAWMHDIGKITTPEHVVDKRTKLEAIFGRIELVETRFRLIARILENRMLEEKVGLLEAGEPPGSSRLQDMSQELARELAELENDLSFIRKADMASEFMSDDKVERLQAISRKTYEVNGEVLPYLTADELKNLCIRRGTLSEEERIIIENHAVMTHKILSQIPFPKTMTKVPEYASSHHEKLDGSGYPLGITGDALPLQSRIMAIADIFEALTAKDRPYRKPMPLSQALNIMDRMCDAGHLDTEIYRLFLAKKLHYQYASKEMAPEQIDTPDFSDWLPSHEK